MAKSVNGPFIIGFFILTGLTILIVSLVWLGATEMFKQQKVYVTYFDGSVEGLERGSLVKYQGVTCGSVKSITVAEGGRLIEVVMQIELNIDINDNIRVQQSMSGIAGGRFLQLHYPSNIEMLVLHPKIDFKPPHPVILSAPSSLEEIQFAAQEVITNMRSLDFETISDKSIEFLDVSTDLLSRQEFYDILTNLVQSTQKLNQIMTQVDTAKFFANFDQTSEVLLLTSIDLQNTVNALDKKIAEVDINGTLDKAYSKYDSTLTDVGVAVSRVAYRAESVVFSINDTFDELRRTNFELQKTLRAFSDNPSQIFLSSPPPPEK